jgi:ectoine hydroxylase-related dioxygenase (phytanoyl-CoA dioxygenase family)
MDVHDVAATSARTVRDALRRDGFVCLRGVLRRSAVVAAKKATLARLARVNPAAFANPADPSDGALVPNARGLGALDAQAMIAAAPEVRAVVEADELFDLAEALLFPERDEDDGDFADDDAGARGSDGDDGVLPVLFPPREEKSRHVSRCEGRRRTTTRTPSRTNTPPSRGRAMTPKYKWLRAVAGGEFTGAHADRVFLRGGTPRFLTAWIPFGDVAIEDGALLIARGSHADPAFATVREAYVERGAVGADGTRSGWLTDDAAEVAAMLDDVSCAGASRRRAARGKRKKGATEDDDVNAVGTGGGTTATATKTEGPSGKKTFLTKKTNQNGFVDWRALDFRAGDVCVLDPRVVHMSSANRSRGDSHRARVSCDTRWQSEGDPADPRVGAWRVRDAESGAVVDVEPS